MTAPVRATHIAHLDALTEGRFAQTARAAVASTSYHRLADELFAPCKGCFECWVKSPGQCGIQDAANELMRDVIDAETLLLTSPVRFGSWHPLAKGALDRTIGLLSPFFRKIENETHHRRRYKSYPRWAALGVVDDEVSEADRTNFVELVRRNSTNFHGGVSSAACLSSSASDTEIEAVVARLLQRPTAVDDNPWTLTLPPPTPLVRANTPPRCLLWVGSAKPRGTSASESLGAFVLRDLTARGWEVDTIDARHAATLGQGRAPALVDAVRRADLVILAAPVYIDTLPALVLQGLSDLREQDLGPTALLPILQCGFPEAVHTELALTACASAVRALGWTWAGHLAVGGGGMVVSRPIAENGPLHKQWQALTQAAVQIDDEGIVGREVSELFGQSIFPNPLYRRAGDMGWLAQARKHGSLLKLWDRPFEEHP